MTLFVQLDVVSRTAATTKATLVTRATSAIRSIATSLSLLAAIARSLFAPSGSNDYGNTSQAPTGAAISFLAPSQANAGGAQFTITVSSPSGGFCAQTVVQWDGK